MWIFIESSWFKAAEEGGEAKRKLWMLELLARSGVLKRVDTGWSTDGFVKAFSLGISAFWFWRTATQINDVLWVLEIQEKRFAWGMESVGSTKWTVPLSPTMYACFFKQSSSAFHFLKCQTLKDAPEFKLKRTPHLRERYRNLYETI